MMNREYIEHIRFTAECLVYALGALNKYPERTLREIAEGTTVGNTIHLFDYQARLLKLCKNADKKEWYTLTANDTPKAKRLKRWMKDFDSI